jgi:dipeptidyl aminopeptidase/acylaminoacyl peptidase
LSCADAGLFDVRAFAYRTDILWFPEDMFCATPMDDPEVYERFSPVSRIQSWKTPALFTHGAQDFRCTVGESVAPFYALRRRNVPAKLVVFPNEGHHISQRGTVVKLVDILLAWLRQWTEREDVDKA